LAIHEATTGKSSIDYLRTLAQATDLNLSMKEYEKAKSGYDICLQGLKRIPDAAEDYFYLLFNAALADHYTNSDATASAKLTEFISIAENNALTDIEEYNKAKTLLSSINNRTGNTSGLVLPEDKAIQALRAAIASQKTNPKDALKHYADCETAIREGNLVNNTSFSCYLNHSRLLYSVNDITNAAAMAKSARLHAEKLFKPDDKEFAPLLIMEADLAFLQDKKLEAVKLYQTAFAANKEPASAFAPQVHWMCEQLVRYAMDEAAMKMAGEFQKNPSFQSASLPEKLNIFKIYAEACLGARHGADLLRESEANLLSEKDPDIRQRLMLSCASALTESGQLDQAANYLRNALNIESKNIVRGELHFELARLEQKLGNYRDAELNYRKAIDYIPTSLSPITFAPQLYNSFATFYIHLGNYHAAEDLFVKLLEKPDNSSFQSSVRHNLGALYEQTGRFDKAKKLMLETIAFDRSHIGEFHPDYALSLQNLATLYKKLNKLDSAQLLIERALAIDKKNSGDMNVTYAAKLANLGAIYQEGGNFEKARQLLEQSLNIRKKLLNTDHPDYAFNMYSLGYLLYRSGQSQAALPYLQDAATYYIKQIKEVFPILSDYERTAFYNLIQPVIDGYQAFLVENSTLKPTLIQDLLNFRLETKALLLSSAVKVRNQILASGNHDLVRKFATWQQTKEQLAILYTLPLQERQLNAETITQYSKKANELEKALSLESEAFATTLSTALIDWKKIQSTLKPEEAAVEIIRVKLPADSIIYAAVVIRPSVSAPQLIISANGRMLEGRGFKRYINGIHYENRDHNSFDIFWKPFQESLNSVKVLYLSADGVYNKINCMTLFDPIQKQFVIDQLNIQLVSNLKDLLAAEERSQEARNAILVGFPDYDLGAGPAPGNEPAQRSFLGDVISQGIADLPGTLQEVSEIDKTLKKYQWNVKLHTSQDAREEVIKAARNPGLLHIATHGFFISPSNENAKQVSGNDLSNIENNVMLRSGLFLTGAEKFLREKSAGKSPSGSEDGVLTAYEVMNLHLDDTRLVVLSACETGVGDVKNGEGVYGLQRAFMLAGAKNLIMSLWKVDDQATQALMTEFYSAWAGSADERSSFHETQLAMKKKFDLPVYWGAFVRVGR
jgi:CHAT domain-containing protein/Flp pilus assembly protein TadD